MDCLPCLGRNIVEFARRMLPDEAGRLSAVRKGMAYLADADMSLTPPEHCRALHEIALGVAAGAGIDPYADEKAKSIGLANEIAANMDRVSSYAPESFESRLRLAIAGNVLDFGIYSNLDMAQALDFIEKSFAKPIDMEAVAVLKERMDSASSILYILDNCGEAVFDRIFMEPYIDRTTFVVRGRNILNDMTRRELEASGFGGAKTLEQYGLHPQCR